MTLTIETGIGVRGADSYASVAFVTAYLTDRGREAENTWSTKTVAEQEEAIKKATDYIEKRYGRSFKGVRKVWFEDQKAEGSITFSGLPSDAETLTLGNIVYTFRTALTVGNDNEVLIGADASGMALNLLNAINADSDTDGTTHEGILEPNRHATAEQDGGTLDLVAAADGTGGNDTVLTTAATNTAVVAFSGGVDGGSQPLSFPRTGLVDMSGNTVEGIPLKLRQAMAEYAVRSLAAELLIDPTDDALDGSIKRLKEKIGPIETDTEYVEGTSGQVFATYPAADELLAEYLKPSGAVRA